MPGIRYDNRYTAWKGDRVMFMRVCVCSRVGQRPNELERSLARLSVQGVA